MAEERRLAAILAADVVGYSRLMEQDETAALKQRRTGILAPLVSNYHGRIVKVIGDGVLVEFPSAVNAVACAVELQKQMAAANDGVVEGRRIVLRIGINLGDVIVEGGDLYGDGVIIAVRRPCRLPFALARRRPALTRPQSPLHCRAWVAVIPGGSCVCAAGLREPAAFPGR